MLKIGILTLSDRASKGVYEDISGPAIESTLRDFIIGEIEFVYRLCSDELSHITATLCELCDTFGCCLVVTTGGTGPALRDVTPEAMEQVCHKMLPGFGELMRNVSLRSVPTAILSRQSAGVRNKSLIVNLPGKPASIRECLTAIFPAIPYCIDLIGGDYIVANDKVISAFRPAQKPSQTLENSAKPQGTLSHLDSNHNPHMVDVSDKNITERVARACGKITVNREAFASVQDATNKKGPVLQTAIIAAVMGAKKTSELIPLCHPLAPSAIHCEIEVLPEESAFLLHVSVKIASKTGVEMEALTGVSIGLLTMHDMLKALDKRMVIGEIRLLHKSGSKSGQFDA